MDELLDYELQIIGENIRFAYKHEWEMTRWQVYCALQPYLKDRRKTAKDLFPLPFDENTKIVNVGHFTTNEEIEAWKKANRKNIHNMK